MSDETWRRNEIESPCVKICVVHPETRLCTGCARSVHEITVWARLSPEARRAIIDDLPNRTANPGTRRGGRAGRRARDAS